MGINTHGSFTVMAVFTRLSIQFVFPRQKKPPDPPETKHGRPIWPLWLAWQLDGPERRNLYVAANFNARRPVTCSRKLSWAWYCAITMADRYAYPAGRLAVALAVIGRGPALANGLQGPRRNIVPHLRAPLGEDVRSHRDPGPVRSHRDPGPP